MAEIVFVSSGIGGGKSLYATRQICLELERSERMIVTNVPIFLEDAPDGYMTIQEWCHKYVDRAIDVKSRVRKLTEEEVFEFWRYLPGKEVMPNVQRQTPSGPIVVPELQSRQGDGGCFYVLDEVHLAFASRDWSKIGNKVEHYMSQLRKMNDDLWLISQHPEKVDKNFRRNATEWLYLQNMAKKRLFGGVSLKGRFRFFIYSQMPTRTDKPDASGWFQLMDKEYQKCYSTMAGSGLQGKLAPEQSRHKGKGPWVWAVIILLCIGLAFLIPKALAYATGRMVGFAVKGVSHGVEKSLTGNLMPQTVTNVSSARPLSRRVDRPDVQEDLSESADLGVRMGGFAHLPSGVLVFLTDGSTYTLGDGHCLYVSPEYCVVDGKKYLRYTGGGLGPGRGLSPVLGSELRRSIGNGIESARQLQANRGYFSTSQPVDLSSRERLRIHFQDGQVVEKEVPRRAVVSAEGDQDVAGALNDLPASGNASAPAIGERVSGSLGR